MDWSKSKRFNGWLSSLVVQFNEVVKDYKNYRYKIVGIDTNEKSSEVSLLVMINGFKKQFIPYCPGELITNDAMLCEFSWYDVRAISFYALQKYYCTSQTSSCSIVGQDLLNGKTIFVINHQSENGEKRKSAHDLYCDDKLLSEFDYDDLKNIISTAIQEQSIEDFKRLEL